MLHNKFLTDQPVYSNCPYKCLMMSPVENDAAAGMHSLHVRMEDNRLPLATQNSCSLPAEEVEGRLEQKTLLDMAIQCILDVNNSGDKIRREKTLLQKNYCTRI